MSQGAACLGGAAQEVRSDEQAGHVTINGIEVEVPEGMLLVEAAAQAGIEIPVFCYHPKLDPVGVCRMCLVEVEGSASR